MPAASNASSSRDTLSTVTTASERRQMGRYVAGGAVLAITLLAVHHVLLREASTIAGVCIPTIIMVCYILWILYSAHRDRRKALRFAAAMQLTEVISVPARPTEAIRKPGTNKTDLKKSEPPRMAYRMRECRENPAFTSKDEAP